MTSRRTAVDDPTGSTAAEVPPCPNGYDPIGPEALRDPWADLAELRDTCPVSLVRTGGADVVVVTRFDDVAAIERDHRTFGNIGHHPHPDAVKDRPAGQRNLSSTDLPRQAGLRRLYLEALRPRHVDDMRPAIAEVVDAVTAKVLEHLDAGPTDLVEEWAVPIPSRVIATVLGLPKEDAAQIHEWVDVKFSAYSSESERAVAQVEFDEYLFAQLARRRELPGDDAISRMMAHVGPDGMTFTDDEVVFYIHDILAAGNETTTSILSNFAFRVLEEPDRYERLRREPSVLDAALEESLRFDTPLMQFARIAHVDAEVAGHHIPAGTVLSLSMPSANRDPRRFGPDADRFVVDRYAEHEIDHLTFGVGIHHCVGAYLARVTARLAVSSLFGRGLPLRLAPGATYEKVHYYEFWRPRQVLVELAGR
jgi:cytochrome P450